MTNLKYCMSCRQMRPAAGFVQMNRYRNSCSVCATRANPLPEPRRRRDRNIGTYVEKLRDLGKID